MGHFFPAEAWKIYFPICFMAREDRGLSHGVEEIAIYYQLEVFKALSTQNFNIWKITLTLILPAIVQHHGLCSDLYYLSRKILTLSVLLCSEYIFKFFKVTVISSFCVLKFCISLTTSPKRLPFVHQISHSKSLLCLNLYDLIHTFYA